jgi:nuclear cap-binding protein subunit 1
MVVEQPFKIPFVAAVVLVLNTLGEKGAGVVEEVVRRVGGEVGKGVREGRWRDVKCGMKFLGGLQGALSGEGVWVLLEDVLAKAVDLQTERGEEVSSVSFDFDSGLGRGVRFGTRMRGEEEKMKSS